MMNLVVENKNLFTKEEFEFAKSNCAYILKLKNGPYKGNYEVGAFGCPEYLAKTLERAIEIVKTEIAKEMFDLDAYAMGDEDSIEFYNDTLKDWDY